jgi:hypothetical protein
MVATFVFGVAPATFLLFYAVIGGAAGIYALLSVRDPGTALRALVFLVAAVLAVFGYIGLLQAARDSVTPRVARWLGAGIVANVVAIGFLVSEPEWLGPALLFVLFAPLVVGCAHLVGFIVRSRQRRASV